MKNYLRIAQVAHIYKDGVYFNHRYSYFMKTDLETLFKEMRGYNIVGWSVEKYVYSKDEDIYLRLVFEDFIEEHNNV